MSGSIPQAWRGDLDDRSIAKALSRLAKTIEPRTALAWEDPYSLLVAVVLSAQATDVSVNAAMVTLRPAAPTPAAMVALGENGIKRHISRIGLANTKARHLVALSRLLIKRHGGQVPDDRANLEALPGVGRKSAGVVLNVAFGRPEIPVDTHVHRIANRLGIARTKRPEDTESVLLDRIPSRFHRTAHHLLILHGRHCCTARAPQCDRCLLANLCRYVRTVDAPTIPPHPIRSPAP